MSGCGCDDRRWRRVLDRRRLLQVLGIAGLVAGSPLSLRSAFAQEATPLPEDSILIQHLPLAELANGSFISPHVEIYGDMAFGRDCFIASNTILNAGERFLVSLRDANNCQDNAYLIANAANLTFGGMVSIAHQAAIENSVVGDFTFFGFRSRVRNCTIGDGAMVMHNTVVEGVTLPPNRITPSGATITTQANADALPEISHENEVFKHEVQHVNHEFATGYAALYAEQGRAAVEEIGHPVTSFNPQSVEPSIGAGVRLGELVRIVGDVRLGDRSRVGQRSALRADEGTPIVIGRNARIGGRVTFHALDDTDLIVGDNASIGDECVLHGPLRVGNNLTCEDGSVLFRAIVEDNVTLREGAKARRREGAKARRRSVR